MRAGSGTSTCKGEAAERVGSGNVCVFESWGGEVRENSLGELM